jgi:lipid II:glycine glycyltransferase (peptidoglycan interpeptide bridge formation enzyme)
MNDVFGDAWNDLISRLPNPHFLQTFEWGQVKARVGWAPRYAIWLEDGSWQVANGTEGKITLGAPPKAAALVLKRSVPIRGLAARMSVLYLPKGPNLDWSDAPFRGRVMDDLQSLAKREGAILLKMDPDVVLGTGIPGRDAGLGNSAGQAVEQDLARHGWQFSSEQVQFRNTVLIDLTASEEDLLARMKQKTRYNIRLAVKKGVTIRTGGLADWPLLYRMYAETSVRDGFVIRDDAYYQTVWSLFHSDGGERASQPLAEPLIAEVEGEPVAALFMFHFSGRAYYVYGMSRETHRDKMPNHLLQWEAMRRAKGAGCTVYDLWGAPERFDESDGMWGVFRFKEGLGGEVVRTLGAWDFAPNRMVYRIYTSLIPRLLGLMRARGKARTQEQIGA